MPPFLLHRRLVMSDLPPDLPVGTPPAPFVTGLLGRCPCCGKASMFKDAFALAERCPACGLDLGFADTGDGPAFFASFIGGFVILALGVWIQIALDPPFWVYPVVFVPLGLVVCLGLIRVSKGVLVSLQYANKAGQERFEP